MRVRQISQGVEDISWRNMKAVTPERDIDIDPTNTPLAERNKKQDAGVFDAPVDKTDDTGQYHTRSCIFSHSESILNVNYLRYSYYK